MIVYYPNDVNEADILSAFNLDPAIEKARFIDNIKPEISSNASIKSFPNQNRNFLDDLHINSAWELSEGMGYLAVMDTGIQTDHPAFAAFTANNNYLGGNLLGGLYAYDYSLHRANVDEEVPWFTNGATYLEPCDAADGEIDS